MIVSVCFITCGLHNHSAEAQEALYQRTPPDAQIVVYENNAKLPLELYRTNVVIISQQSGKFDGIATARNRCLEAARGDIIIWIDDDIIVCPNYVDAFVQPFADGSVGIVGYDACKLTGREDFLDLCHVDPFIVEPDYFDSPYAIRKRMAEELNGYDEQLGSYDCDNTDLCLRARANGWKLQPIKNPGIVHWMGSTRDILKSRDEQNAEWKRSYDRMNAKHSSGWRKRYNMLAVQFEKDERIQYLPGELRKVHC